MLAVTILVQSVTLTKLIRSGNYKAFVRITAIFLLTNVAGIFGTLAFFKYFKDTTNYFWLAVYSLSVALNSGLINLADW